MLIDFDRFCLLVSLWCGFAGTMVTLGGNACGVRVGTLVDGAGKSVWSAPVGTSRGVFGVIAVGGFSVTFEKMHASVCMAANCFSPSVAKGVEVGCKRASAKAGAAVVAALVDPPAGTGQSCGKKSTVLRCVLHECVGCRRGGIGSAQGRVQGTNHLHSGGPRCGGCRVSCVL